MVLPSFLERTRMHDIVLDQPCLTFAQPTLRLTLWTQQKVLTNCSMGCVWRTIRHIRLPCLKGVTCRKSRSYGSMDQRHWPWRPLWGWWACRRLNWQRDIGLFCSARRNKRWSNWRLQDILRSVYFNVRQHQGHGCCHYETAPHRTGGTKNRRCIHSSLWWAKRRNKCTNQNVLWKHLWLAS